MLEQHLTAFIVNYYYYYSRDKFNRDNLYAFTSTVKFSGKISFSKNIARRCWGRSERERERERRGVLGCSRAWNRGRAQFRVSTSDDPLLRPGHPTAIRYSPLFLHRFQLFVVLLSSPTGYFRMENRGEKEKKRSLFPFFFVSSRRRDFAESKRKRIHKRARVISKFNRIFSSVLVISR